MKIESRKFVWLMTVLVFAAGIVIGYAGRFYQTRPATYPEALTLAYEILWQGIENDQNLEQCHINSASGLGMQISQEKVDYWASKILEKKEQLPNPQWEESYQDEMNSDLAFAGGSAAALEYHVRGSVLLEERCTELETYFMEHCHEKNK